MRRLAADDLVHDYLDRREFRRHASGSTDRLGNLGRGNTWVRFSPTGLTVIGEIYTATTTLADVVQAVGTRSFIYELFPVDDLTSKPRTRAGFAQANARLMDKFGVHPRSDSQRHGAESLFPKIGWTFAGSLRWLTAGAQSVFEKIKLVLGRRIVVGGWRVGRGRGVGSWC
jgi:hypothetical protein